MTSGGMLEHEGSISPRDPHVRSSNPTGKSMVLDIDDIAPRPGRIVPLTLRKRDERRKATQTWKFSEVLVLFDILYLNYIQLQFEEA